MMISVPVERGPRLSHGLAVPGARPSGVAGFASWPRWTHIMGSVRGRTLRVMASA